VLKLKSVSKCKRLAIQEAITEWEKAKNKETIEGRQGFKARMINRGWKWVGTGAYKACLSKSTIILKYAINPDNSEAINEVNREFEQWKYTSNKFKKHLARTYTLIDGMLVQDKVLQKCGNFCDELNTLSKEYPNLGDAWTNHGHSLRGKLKFFDWVYNRNWHLRNNPDIKLVEK
jgi:hypothetical protein